MYDILYSFSEQVWSDISAYKQIKRTSITKNISITSIGIVIKF